MALDSNVANNQRPSIIVASSNRPSLPFFVLLCPSSSFVNPCLSSSFSVLLRPLLSFFVFLCLLRPRVSLSVLLLCSSLPLFIILCPCLSFSMLLCFSTLLFVLLCSSSSFFIFLCPSSSFYVHLCASSPFSDFL